MSILKQSLILPLSLLALNLAGCGGSGTTSGGIEALSLADSMSVVTTNSGGSSASVAPESQADPATFPSTSDYKTDVAQSHVYDPSMDPLQTVNMILCLLKQTAYSGLLNQGLYKAQIDELSCNSGGDGDSSSGTGHSSGAEQSFSVWVIDSSRASRTGAQELEFWIPGGSQDGEIRVHVSVTKGVSDENPFGVFDLNYHQFESDNSTTRGFGNLHTLDAAAGFAGFSFYQEEGDVDSAQMPNEEARRIQANVLMSADQTTGTARIVSIRRENHGSGDSGQQIAEYRLAFDETHVARETVGVGTACLSRTSFDTKTWRYNLYDAETGDRVELQSGFGFQTQSGKYGWAGYYGLWLPQGETLADGATVTRNTYGQSTPQSYTVLKARGKLYQNTRHMLALTALAGESFEWWHQGAGPGQPVVRNQVQYQSPNWVVVGTWNDSNSDWDVVEPPTAIDTAAVGVLGMWSSSLGGSCSFVDGASFITYYERELVGPTHALFGSATNVDLYGFHNCLRPGITSSEATAGDIYFPNSYDVNSPVVYTIHGGDMTFTTDVMSTPVEVGLGDAQEPSGGPYTWGMNSGAMVTAADWAGLKDTSGVYTLDTFYTYETGANPWNQLAILFDASENPVVFDKPIQFSYTHHTADDANGSATFDNRTFLLNYNGPGELGGIPYQGVDLNADNEPDRWYPKFSVVDATLCGPTGTEYVMRAIESELNLGDDTGNCGTLTSQLAGAASLTLPTSADWVDPALGPMPTVIAPPRAIKGEIVGSSN